MCGIPSVNAIRLETGQALPLIHIPSTSVPTWQALIATALHQMNALWLSADISESRVLAQ